MNGIFSCSAAAVERLLSDAVDEPRTDVPPQDVPDDLSKTKVLLLRAVTDLGAFAYLEKVTATQIAAQIGMNADTRLRSELSSLRALRCLGGGRGERGYWITERGRQSLRRSSAGA